MMVRRRALPERFFAGSDRDRSPGRSGYDGAKAFKVIRTRAYDPIRTVRDKFFLGASASHPTAELDFMSAAKILKPTDTKEVRQSIPREVILSSWLTSKHQN